jgi:adenylate cyclase
MPASPPLQPKQTRARFPRPLLLAAVIAVLTGFVLSVVVPVYAPGLLRFEHALADVRTSLLSDQLPSQHPSVAIVGITDRTLSSYKTRIPIDRVLLARVVDAVDAAGAKVIGMDILSVRTATPDNEELLVEALKRAKAKVVLAAADERIGLSQAEAEQQKRFIAEAGRPAGYVNLATERDWVVRFKAQPSPGSAYPKSFARLLAESAGYTGAETSRRIAWLREPLDGSDTFLTVPAETLLAPPEDPGARVARQGLQDKIVIIGGLFPDLDRHLTPMSTGTREQMAGATIHAQILADMLDGRSIGQLEANSAVQGVGLAVLAGFGFLIGWRYRLKRQGLLLSSIATIVIIAADTFAFFQFRIILPIVLAVLAWFVGEFSGHYLGHWLGYRPSEQSRWFVK